MVFAEAVSIDGGVLLAVLVVFMVLLGIWSGLVVLGCRLARQAGAGSAGAGLGWALVAVAQTMPLTLGNSGLLVFALAILGLQGTFFLHGRAGAETVEHR